MGIWRKGPVIGLAAAAATLTACGSREDRTPAPASAETSKPSQTRSPVEFSTDVGERRRQQTEIMERMMEDLRVPTDTVEGEAARRGVDIDPARLEGRRAAEKARPSG